MNVLRIWLSRALRIFIPKNTVLPIISGPLRGAKWIVRSGVFSYWLGTYEKEIQNQFNFLVKEGDIVFDIGAHIGFYTLLASRLVGRTGKVFSFEPNSQNLSYLRRHIDLNNCHNVVVIESAVSSKEGRKVFYESESSFTGSLYPLDFKPTTSGEVVVKSLDLELERGRIPPPRIIKIDVEGEEYAALKGAKNLIEKFKPHIMIAFHGEDLARNCIDFLCSFNYKFISPTGASLENIKGGEIVAYFGDKC